MITITNLSYGFPKKDLYQDISFTINKKDHCAFIGTSGSGKSTLIKILLDPDNYMYDGTIEMDNLKIGYVSQLLEVAKHKETTVFDYIAKDFLELQKRIEIICDAMATGENLEKHMADYQEAYDAYEAIGGDDYASTIEKKLNLADLLSHKDLFITQLSGGEFKLVQIIKEMLHRPDLMIMDEPDVFLDFENINALKNLINGYKGAMFIITHNRFLLNHCFNKIVHLENLQLQEFEGTYIDYNLELLKTKVELQEMSIADDEEIERNERLIEKLRFDATNHAEASKGRALKARVKIQERLEAKRTRAPFVEIKQPRIYIENESPLEEQRILKLTDYHVAFEDALIEDVNFEIQANDKVALLGLNGTGKTTLLRDIYRNEKDSIEINEAVKISYLSQHQGETFSDNHSILEEFYEAGMATYGEIKSHLFSYGFEEKILKENIQSLSGGEKNLLQIAKVAAQKHNFLLLDEPTSHLDTYSQIALEKAINNYNGAVLMTSHDYYTIINCMDYVLFIEDNKLRKMKLKKFKRKTYKNHFDRDYLELEQKKKTVELEVEQALKAKDFQSAKDILVRLEALIHQYTK